MLPHLPHGIEMNRRFPHETLHVYIFQLDWKAGKKPNQKRTSSDSNTQQDQDRVSCN